ncbi:sensor histidine kinase [Nitrospirillum viridazoti]|uniref:histidine kinase n=1 Tax=Nitrospirillum viridazoti CBAmc TaxID=1441467 RepID=A0A248K0X3_9PROT|nr:ATP-binding protein [Nitrospirillum amazonense]ASG24068.1 histidine kinase [Nitrospirillum amazonense CBAmc]TWB40949.1 signal transduction histidine kinase [Nitrospirillum amazonense]
MMYRPASLLAAAVLLFSAMSLLIAGIQEVAGGPGKAVRLTQAEVLAAIGNTPARPPATLDGQGPTGTWRPINLPYAEPMVPVDQTVPAMAPGYPAATWIRVLARDLPVGAGPLALYGARIDTDGPYAIYVNGKLVDWQQRQGRPWNGLFTPLWLVLDQDANTAPPADILIRLDHAPTTPVALSSLWVGPEPALNVRHRMRQLLQRELPMALNSAFLAVGVFSLFVWFRRRHDTGYLLFFSLAAISFAAHLHFYLDVPITSDWFAWLTINALFWLIVILHLFLRMLHGRPLTLLTAAVVGVTSVISILTLPVVGVLPVLPSTPVIVPRIYAAAVVMAATVSVVGVACAWPRFPEARLLAGGLALCTVLGQTDWMMHNHVLGPEGWFLGAYTNAVTFAMCGTVMYRRYVAAIAEVERVNASLAERLRAREAELEISHQRLREAERRRTISEERQRLMQDMHDGVGASLISAIRSVEQGAVDDAKVSQILKGCLDDLKLAIDSMEPVDADLLLLLASLRYRLEPRLEGSGITLVWDVRDLPTLAWLDPSSALHILRILQEGIANILHHAQASRIRLGTAPDIQDERAGVCVTIEDDGRGFDTQAALAAAGGRGLRNQQRRAQAVGGSVAWASGPMGTRFTLWLPLTRGAAVAD